MIDSLCEIADIVAGNVKALLPLGWELSFPVANPVAEFERRSRVAHQVFECDGESMLVELVEGPVGSGPPPQ